MTLLTAQRMRPALTVVIALATGFMLAWSSTTLWRLAGHPDAFFGGDLTAYTAAADRLVASGSPYHPRLLEGPVENTVANVPIGYFYPPPLAQAFVLARGVDPVALAWLWLAPQTALIIVLTPLVWRRFGGRLTPLAIAGLGFTLTSSWPLAFALFGGNVSAWIAIGIAVMLICRAQITGISAGLVAVLKLTPAPFAWGAFLDQQTRIPTIAALVAVVGASFALNPAAWADWLQVLPNLVGNQSAQGLANYSAANIGTVLGMPAVGAGMGVGLTVMFLAALLLIASKDGFGLPAVAAATFAYLFASPTLWDHYCAALVPLVVAAFPTGGVATRALLVAYVAWSALRWFVQDPAWLVVNGILITGVGVALTIPGVMRTRALARRLVPTG